MPFIVLGSTPTAWAALIYVGLGVLFALYFATKGVSKLDPTAEGAPLGFRMLMLPGAAALWPLLMAKLLRDAPEGEKA